MRREKLMLIRQYLKSAGKIPAGRDMSDDAVITFCVEVMYSAVTKRLGRSVANARNGRLRSAEELKDAAKMRHQFANSEESVLLARNSHAREMGRAAGDADRIAAQFGHTLEEVRRHINGPSDGEAQMIEEALRATR